jgi:transposase
MEAGEKQRGLGRQEMSGYSLDLRERVVKAVEKGHSQLWVAREFGIGIGTVKRYLKRKAQLGHLKPTQQGRMKPLLTDEQLPALQAQVDAHADYTLAQHVELWAQTHGVQLSCPTMCRAMQRAQRVLKKNGLRHPAR